MTDDEFIAAFEDCSLRSEEFHHKDHVRMGFLYLCRFPPPTALQRFSEALKRLATARGKPELYHETITWAFLLLIRERMGRWDDKKARERSGRIPTWEEFAGDNPDLLDWKESVLKKYYREETLASEFARGTFVFPDRIPE